MLFPVAERTYDAPMVGQVRQSLDLATKVRLGFAVVTLLYAALSETFIATFPWALLVVGLDLALTSLVAWPVPLPLRRMSVEWFLIGASALCAGLAFNVIGSPAIPLAFIPAYHAGLVFGRLGFLAAGLVSAVAGAFAVVLGHNSPLLQQGARGFFIWLVATLCLGALGAWSLRLRGGEESVESLESREARILLRRLGELASEHGTELDPASTGSALLEDLASVVRNDRSGVLVRDEDGPLQPLAVRGSRRLDHLPDEGALTDTVLNGQAVGMEWVSELGARSVLAAPLTAESGTTMGVVLLERAATEPFTSEEKARLARACEAGSGRVEVSLLFSSLQTLAILEERQLLAREMHDGIAQDLAALGYSVDAARSAVSGTAPHAVPSLDLVRASLGEVITGLRARIADLHMRQRPDRSLAAIMAAAVQSFGAASGIRTTVSTEEGSARLPAHIESAFFHATMAQLAEARRGGAREVVVRASFDGSSTAVTVEHDGEVTGAADGRTSPPREVPGCHVARRVRPDGRTIVTIFSPDEQAGAPDRSDVLRGVHP